jgi:hypothetical protein
METGAPVHRPMRRVARIAVAAATYWVDRLMTI